MTPNPDRESDLHDNKIISEEVSSNDKREDKDFNWKVNLLLEQLSSETDFKRKENRD